jgi:glycerol-3-phosphate dehydrogenase
MNNLNRNVSSLADRSFDLLIIGGGIFGCAAAWEAASRGLSVALIEKDDFSHATSANHFKMVHGGIRYLQHLDVPRIRESSCERSVLLKIAPHLVHPLPIVIPTYGHGAKGKEFLAAGMLVYDLLTADRNHGLHADRRIPLSRFLTRRQVLNLFPGVHEQGLTGGALFCDGQMYHPPRLAISFLRSAAAHGAIAANYVEAIDFLRRGNTITGVLATDRLSGARVQIHGRVVMVTSGPWSHRLVESSLGQTIQPVPTFSRDLAFVVPRKFKCPYAIAFSTTSKDTDSVIDTGGRRLFAVPWKNFTLVGVWHRVCRDDPDHIDVTPDEIATFAAEVNSAFPGLRIALSEISVVNTGLTLFGDESQQESDNLSFGKRSLLVDHRQAHGLEGLISLIGVRATTARGMAEKAVNVAIHKLGKVCPPSRTDRLPIFGGDYVEFEALRRDLRQSHPDLRPTDAQAYNLLCHYGSQFHRVLEYASTDAELLSPIADTEAFRVEIVHAVKAEMAVHLDDLVFRRLDLGTGMLPSDAALNECAGIMGSVLGWHADDIASELARVKALFPHWNHKYRHEAFK